MPLKMRVSCLSLRARRTCLCLCIIVLLIELSVSAKLSHPDDGNDRTTTTITVTSTVTTGTNRTTTVTTAIDRTTMVTTTTTQISTVTPNVGLVERLAEFPYSLLIVLLAVTTSTSIILALIRRSGSRKVQDELTHLRRQVELGSQLPRQLPSGTSAPAASSALKDLYEAGVLSPKEYMEKKMLTDRLERKMSAKQLLDEGLITKEQYELLVRREQQ